MDKKLSKKVRLATKRMRSCCPMTNEILNVNEVGLRRIDTDIGKQEKGSTSHTQTVIGHKDLYDLEIDIMDRIDILILTTMYLTFFSIIFLYYRTLFKKANKLLNRVTDEESILYKNCRVWFRNYDILKKKNIREIAPFETLNNYNRCDIYVNERNFVIVGKWKTWIGERDLVPTIFHYEELNPSRRRFVKVKNVLLNRKDLEIEFIDILYEHVMTLVIKKPENNLVEIILQQFQKCRPISVRDN